MTDESSPRGTRPMSDERLAEFRQMESGDRLTREEVELLDEVHRLRADLARVTDLYQHAYADFKPRAIVVGESSPM